MITKNRNFQVVLAYFETAFAKYNEISRYKQRENAFYRFVVSLSRVHGDSVNNRVARGEMTRNIYSDLLGRISKWLSYQTS